MPPPMSYADRSTTHDVAAGRQCRGISSRTRRSLPEREHRLGDLAGRRSGHRSGGLLEDEHARLGDLTRDRLAVAEREEQVAAAMNDERGDPDLGQTLAPTGGAVELGERRAQLIGHLD